MKSLINKTKYQKPLQNVMGDRPYRSKWTIWKGALDVCLIDAKGNFNKFFNRQEEQLEKPK